MKWDAEKYDLTHAPQVDAGRELIEMAGVRAGDSILDIGCGTGTLQEAVCICGEVVEQGEIVDI
jgi:ubiquinone/menaquinone biosynthesis C-methylase UbiE